MDLPPEPRDKYFDAVLTVVKENIAKIVTDENERRFYESLVTGATSSAACCVTYCMEMKAIYAEGGAEKALNLTKLFALLMLVQSYRWLTESGSGPEITDDASKMAAVNLLALFGEGDEKYVDLFSRLKKQFYYDSEKMPSMVHMGGIMLGWAGEAMGHPCFDWHKLKFPVASMTAITSSGALIDSKPMRSPGDIKTLWACHAMGCKALMEHYEGRKLEGNSASADTESG